MSRFFSPLGPSDHIDQQAIEQPLTETERNLIGEGRIVLRIDKLEVCTLTLWADIPIQRIGGISIYRLENESTILALAEVIQRTMLYSLLVLVFTLLIRVQQSRKRVI